MLCHTLQIEDGYIKDYQLRQHDPKRKSVAAFQSLGYEVRAAGDSFNDVSMLDQADHGAFFCAPQAIAEQFPQYETTQNYAQLRAWLEGL